MKREGEAEASSEAPGIPLLPGWARPACRPELEERRRASEGVRKSAIGAEPLNLRVARAAVRSPSGKTAWSRRMRRQTRPGGGRQIEVTIASIGGRGDGVGYLEDRPVFVPGALAGDRLRVRLTGARAGGFKGQIVEMLAEGPGRVAPPCPHFGPCGGCTLQHLAEDHYVAWKRHQVVQALGRQGLPGEVVAPLVRVPGGSRRRVSLAAQVSGKALRLGFHERERHSVVDIAGCQVMAPALAQLLPALRGVLGVLVLPGVIIDIEATLTESGPDLLLVLPGPPDLAAREALAGFAEASGLARLSWMLAGGQPELLAQHRLPVLRFGGVAVTPPSGGFVQPTVQGEAALTAAVLGFLPDDVTAVADLYAGCGTFSFPLARRARVRAVEGNAAAAEALSDAARRNSLAGRIEVETRDLARRPLPEEALSTFDCVVFDPPRSGAKTQAERLAASKVRTAIAVSCSANSFARDARILQSGGFSLEAVTPIDQFPWSSHVELVALFTR